MTVAALLHAYETKEVHAAFPKPPQEKEETDLAYQTRLKTIVNPRFHGCFYPEFISYSGGVGVSLHSKTTVGRFIRVLHGKGSSGEDNFRKGLRQMESTSLCLLLSPPVDSMYNGYTSIDVTTIR